MTLQGEILPLGGKGGTLIGGKVGPEAASARPRLEAVVCEIVGGVGRRAEVRRQSRIFHLVWGGWRALSKRKDISIKRDLVNFLGKNTFPP